MPRGARSACADQDPHKIPQLVGARASRPARPKARRAARSRVLASGTERPATRGDGDPVIELEYGITVYPAREGQDRWRAVRGMISALVGAGVEHGYLASPRLAKVHWQASGRRGGARSQR
jgi:hypothetical protein